MSSDTHHSKHSLHPIRKKILGWILRVVLAVLFLEFVVYFGSNIFLAEYARQKVNEATEGVYLVEFNRINFSLIRRGVFLNGLVMKPVDSDERNDGQTLFDFTLDEVGFSGLWYDFADNYLTIGSIYLDNPNFSLDEPVQKGLKKPSSLKKDIVSPVRLLEEEIRKSLQQRPFVKLFIRQIEIDHANGFFLKFLSKNNLEAENTSLIVKDINWTENSDWKTPFNAQAFEFNLEKIRYPLPDLVHKIQASKVFISSSENVIDVRNFSLMPDYEKESPTYYEVHLDKLLLGNVDMNQVFLTSNLEVDELILNSPDFKVLTGKRSINEGDPNGDLNEFIQGQLNSISIKELAINKGRFSKALKEDSLRNRIELEELNFKMVDFYLGNDSLKKVNQFFYGQDASMVIHGGKLFLGDGIHVFTGDRIEVSSFKDELRVIGVQISPLQGQLSDHLIKISLEEIFLDEIDFKNLYNHGLLTVGSLDVLEPAVEYISFGRLEPNSIQSSVSDFIIGFLDKVSIENFRVDRGKIQFTDERGNKTNDIGFDEFSFKLEGLEINPDPSLPIYEQFISKEIYISLNNYLLKLRDNLHLFEASNLTLDSKEEMLQIENLSIRPESQELIDLVLEKTGKTAAIDFFVPLFRADGIDVQNALFNQNLIVEKIILPKPKFSISVFQKPITSKKSPQSTEDIRELLLGYFNQIYVDSILLNQATIDFQSLGQSQKSRFHEDEFYLTLKNFSIHPGDSSISGKTLFSEEIDLTFNNYFFNIAGGKYFAEIDRMNYNSKEEALVLDGLTLQPGQNFRGSIALGLDFPKVDLQGVDIEEFIFGNTLDLRKVQVREGEVSIGIDKMVKPAIRSNGVSRVAKTINRIEVDSISAQNSYLEVNFLTNDRVKRSVQTRFEFLIQDFTLDTLALDKNEIGTLYSSADLSLENFEFALPDSIHTINFSEVSLSQESNDIVFKDFSVVPKNHLGNPGFPVVEARFEEIGVRVNDLEEIVQQGKVDVSKFKLSDAKVQVFLDDTIQSRQLIKKSESPKKGLIDSFLIRTINLENGSFEAFLKSGKRIPGISLPNLDLNLDNLDFDLLGSPKVMDLTLLFSTNPRFNFSNYQWYNQDSSFRVDFGKIEYAQGNLSISDVLIRPYPGIFQYLREKGYQSDVISGPIKRIQLTGLDLKEYVQNRNLVLNSLAIEGASIDLFRDKRVPIDSSSYREMPQKLMQNARIRSDIGSIHIKNSRIRYFEWSSKSSLPGGIIFDNLEMDMAPFYLRRSNETFPLDRQKIGVKADIMGKSALKLNATLRFDPISSMDVEFELDTLNLLDINPFLEKTQFMTFQKGIITGGEWSFELNDDYSFGQMKLGYSNLKVGFVDSLTFENGKGKLNFYGFLANLIAKNNNPRSLASPLVKQEIYQVRDKSRFIFNAWWRSTLSGLKGTFGFGKVKVPKAIRKEEEGS